MIRHKIAEVHMLDSGHFAVEDHLGVIADHIKRFYGEKVATVPRAAYTGQTVKGA